MPVDSEWAMEELTEDEGVASEEIPVPAGDSATVGNAELPLLPTSAIP
jgi:hypothetical protein